MAFCIFIFALLAVVLCTVISPLLICLLWFLCGLVGVLIFIIGEPKVLRRTLRKEAKDAFICTLIGPTALMAALGIILTDWIEK